MRVWWNLKKKNFDSALNYFNESLKTDKNNPKILYNIASTHLFKGDYERAISYIEQTFKNLNSNDEEIKLNAYFTLGNSYFHQQQYLKAIESYKKGLFIKRSNLDLKRNLEIAIKKLRDKETPNQQKENQRQQKQPQQVANQSNVPKKNDLAEKRENQRQLNSAKTILESFENRQQNSLTRKRYQEKRSKRKLEKNW